METGNNTNQEVIDKIFDMMENFTRRMIEIENNLWYDNTKSWHQITDNWIIPEHKYYQVIKYWMRLNFPTKQQVINTECLVTSISVKL